MKKTVKIFDENDNLYGEYDYLDFLDFRIDFLTKSSNGAVPKLYIENGYGGRDLINKFGTVIGKEPFFEVQSKLKKIVELQMNLRIKEEKQKEVNAG